MDTYTSAKINWFPGHMKKAHDQLKKLSSQIDGIIEIVDARAPTLTHNSEIISYFLNKPKLILALKTDLAQYKPNKKILFGSLKEPFKLKKKVLKTLTTLFANKRQQLKAKGLLIKQFRLAVIGMPNVGKSSLINLLINKNHLKVANRAGITKSLNWIQISPELLLSDTPGVFLKRIDEIQIGYKLVLTNVIRREVVNIEEVGMFAFNYLKKHYKQLLPFEADSFINFLEKFAKVRGLIKKANELNTNLACEIFINELINGKYGKLSYELN